MKTLILILSLFSLPAMASGLVNGPSGGKVICCNGVPNGASIAGLPSSALSERSVLTWKKGGGTSVLSCMEMNGVISDRIQALSRAFGQDSKCSSGTVAYRLSTGSTYGGDLAGDR